MIILIIVSLSLLLAAGQEAYAQEPSFSPTAHVDSASPARGEEFSKKPGENSARARTRGFSIGIFGSLIPEAKGSMIEVDDRHPANVLWEPDEDYTWGVAGGVGFFGEYQVIPFLSLGLECSVSFPLMEITGVYGDGDAKCEECRRSFFLQVLSRWKVPIEVYKKIIKVYAITYVGYSGYIERNDPHYMWIYHAIKYYHGFGLGWGFGIEYVSRYNAVFLEIRCLLNNVWNKHLEREKEEMVAYGGPSLLLGLEFP